MFENILKRSNPILARVITGQQEGTVWCAFGETQDSHSQAGADANLLCAHNEGHQRLRLCRLGALVHQHLRTSQKLVNLLLTLTWRPSC